MSASMLLYCVGEATRPGLCPIAKETASAAPTLRTEYAPNGMDGWVRMRARGGHRGEQDVYRSKLRKEKLEI